MDWNGSRLKNQAPSIGGAKFHLRSSLEHPNMLFCKYHVLLWENEEWMVLEGQRIRSITLAFAVPHHNRHLGKLSLIRMAKVDINQFSCKNRTWVPTWVLKSRIGSHLCDVYRRMTHLATSAVLRRVLVTCFGNLWPTMRELWWWLAENVSLVERQLFPKPEANIEFSSKAFRQRRQKCL